MQNIVAGPAGPETARGFSYLAKVYMHIHINAYLGFASTRKILNQSKHVCVCVCLIMYNVRVHTFIHTYIYMYVCTHRVQGISRNYVQKLRGKFQAHTPDNSGITVGFFKRLARNRETKEACSGTSAKLVPQHGHAFLDAI